MISTMLNIKNSTGLHTRPGQKFVIQAKNFTCDITVKKEDKEVNAKSLLKLLKLGISQGDTIELICNGTDEQEAMDTLVHFVNELQE